MCVCVCVFQLNAFFQSSVFTVNTLTTFLSVCPASLVILIFSHRCVSKYSICLFSQTLESLLTCTARSLIISFTHNYLDGLQKNKQRRSFHIIQIQNKSFKQMCVTPNTTCGAELQTLQHEIRRFGENFCKLQMNSSCAWININGNAYIIIYGSDWLHSKHQIWIQSKLIHDFSVCFILQNIIKSVWILFGQIKHFLKTFTIHSC